MGLEEDAARIRNQRSVEQQAAKLDARDATARYLTLYQDTSRALGSRGLASAPYSITEYENYRTWYRSYRRRSRQFVLAERAWTIPTGENLHDGHWRVVGERMLIVCETGLCHGGEKRLRVPHAHEFPKIQSVVARYLAILDERRAGGVEPRP